ncbi:MAG: hypothetical protein IJW55_02465 [Clostridia bacterium]|nr:hypothetical protein [Clostridia bacterium]
MKIEKIEKHGTVREGYQILLRADAELLLPEEKPLMREFYLHLAQTCMTWAQSVYGESLRKEFLALESVREKSQFRAQHYHLKMRIPWEEGIHAAILCESKLTGQWKEPQKSYHRISHVWNTEEETLLPFSEILKTFGIKLSQGKLPFRPDGIYPEGEQMVFFRNVTDHMAFLEQKLPRSAEI